MKKFKVGLFIDSFFPSIDGVVMVVDNYAKRLNKYCDVVVVTPAPYDREYVDNFPYKVIRIKSFVLPKNMGKFVVATPNLEIGIVKELMSEKFDIIHIHSPFTIGKLGIKVAKKLNIPVIATMHTQFHLEFYRYTKSEKITKLLLYTIMKIFNECYECWAVNKRIAQIFIDYGYKEVPKIANNGTDLTLTNEKEAFNIINQKYNIKKNEHLFLFVGRINILKNLTFIIEVMKYLKKSKLKFKMLFVGTGPDTKILLEKIKSCKIGDNIIFAGEVTDRNLLAQIYSRASLFIFPSLFDASSLVQVEAASQKTPSIFIDGAATADTIINNQNGYTAPNDPELFAIRITKILKDKKEYEKVCENAYREVYKSWDTLTEETYQRYLEIKKESN